MSKILVVEAHRMLQQAIALGLIGFVVGKTVATLWAPLFPKYVLLIPGDAIRGFILVMDRKTALFFYQQGDHFSYDGFEMGQYNKGEVTVVDTLKKISPYL